MTRLIVILCFLMLVRTFLSSAFAVLPTDTYPAATPLAAYAGHNAGVVLPVTLNAAQINNDLTQQGRAVLYGVLFTADKTTIKSLSISQLEEIAKALQSNPDLRVFITVHTDNLGMLDYNLRLSQRRAQAVVAALITHYGVDGRRLVARGMAQLAPLTSNATVTGRIRNSRLEVVEIATPASYVANTGHNTQDDSHSG